MNTQEKVIEFWKPVIRRRDLFPSMHYILRLTLALCPGSNDVERLFHLLNRINRQDRRNLNMLLMERLLIVARDFAPWHEYDVAALAADFRKVTRARNMRATRKDKGTKRRKTDGPVAEVASDPESLPDEHTLSDVTNSGSESDSLSSSVPAALPPQIQALVQGSRILINLADHYDVAKNGECPALLYVLSV